MHDRQFPILSVGSALPRRRVTNAELAEMLAARGVETSDAWIAEMTGIGQRYFCEEEENTFTLARHAVETALSRAGVRAADVGVLVVATCTPPENFPSVAAQVHGALGMPPACMALDINAACSGFVHALAVARGLLESQQARYAVVAGAEQFSKILDFDDRRTCVLFGDGAGAVVMAREELNQGAPARGLLAVKAGTDGEMGPALTTHLGHISMQGREVFKHAVRQMGRVPAVLAEAGLALENVDHVVPHQANVRILEAAAKTLGVDPAKVVMTVGLHANTSAASIPLALDVAAAGGRFAAGDILLLQAFGAGFTWSDAVVRWG